MNYLGGYAFIANARLLRQVPSVIVQAASNIAAFNAMVLRGFKPESQLDMIYKQRKDEAMAALQAINSNALQFNLLPDKAIPLPDSSNHGAYVDASGNPVYKAPNDGSSRNQ